MDNFTVIDLFSGAGGLSRGFIDAGYQVILGIDNDETALKTFKLNHLGAEVLKLDLSDLNNVIKIKEKIAESSIHVLVGGPPCQGFSLAGPRIENDDRNTLYQAMVKVASELKPKAVILENVPGLQSLHNGSAAKRIIYDFESLGYKMNQQILYAPDYGVPQTRKRIFFVGLLNGSQKFVFPEPTYSPINYITCGDAISDLPSLDGIYGDPVQEYPCPPMNDFQRIMRKNSAVIHNHIGTKHIEKTIRFLSMVPEGSNYKALPEIHKNIYKYHEALTRYDSKKPSPTINTGHRSHFHYLWNRIPTVRESARLQTFPDDFIFIGNKSQQYRQVGNAVPPFLGKVIALELKKYLMEMNKYGT